MSGRTLLVSLAVALAASCGGSSSDTPWPAEPETTPPGPLGEGSPGFDLVDGGPPLVSATAAPPPAPRQPLR